MDFWHHFIALSYHVNTAQNGCQLLDQAKLLLERLAVEFYYPFAYLNIMLEWCHVMKCVWDLCIGLPLSWVFYQISGSSFLTQLLCGSHEVHVTYFKPFFSIEAHAKKDVELQLCGFSLPLSLSLFKDIL